MTAETSAPTRLPYLILGILALAAGIVWAYLRAEPAVKTGEVRISESLIDLGSIDPEGGPVTRTLDVTNVGRGTLTLHRLSTSCGCTTAEMDMSDMAPGETRTMTVTFDPAVHPDLRGPIVRVVYLQTSDPASPETSIDLRGDITNETTL